MNDNPRIPRYRISLVRETGITVEYPSQITESDKAALIFREVFAELDREQFAVATLDSKNKIIGINIVSVGTLSGSLAHPRETLKLAVLQNAAAVILAHNHPSGDPTPSREDNEMFERITKAGEIVGIRVLDSIVIGERSYYSMKDQRSRDYPVRSDYRV